MNLRVTFTSKVKGHEARSRSESEPEQGVCPLGDKAHASAFELVVVDAKPSDLHMSRMKSR